MFLLGIFLILAMFRGITVTENIWDLKGLDVSKAPTIINPSKARDISNLLVSEPLHALTNEEIGFSKQEIVGFPEGIVSIVQLGKGEGVLVFDGDTNILWKTFGGSGTSDGQFDYPFSATADSKLIYISDRDNHRIQKFNWNGMYVNKFGSQGSGNDEFNQPHGLKLWDDELYVVDHANARIVVTDTDGTYQRKWSILRGAEGFTSAQDVNIQNIGGTDYVDVTIWKVDTTYTAKIRRYQTDGTYVDEFTPASLYGASGINSDSSGNIYICSRPTEAIQGTGNYDGGTIRKYDSSMNFLQEITFPAEYANSAWLAAMGYDPVPDPYEIEITDAGEIICMNPGATGYAHGVYVWDSAGTFQRKLFSASLEEPPNYYHVLNPFALAVNGERMMVGNNTNYCAITTIHNYA